MNVSATQGNILSKIESYIKTSLDIVKLQTIDRTADILSSFVSGIVLLMIVGTFLLSLNIGLSLWIGKLLGESFLGFLLVSFLYLIIGIVVWFLRERTIEEPVSKHLLKRLLKNTDLDSYLSETDAANSLN